MTNKKNLRKPLGRGLASLISAKPVNASASPDNTNVGNLAISRSNPGDKSDNPATRIAYISHANLAPNPNQPRQDFNQEELKELADSIKVHGVLQPILVRPASKSLPAKYQIIAGERRWRAAKLAGLDEVPVMIQQLDDKHVLEIALIENIQRENLNPVELALAYQRLSDDFSFSQKEIAERVGKDRASVANFLRLLTLPANVLELIRLNQLTMGHAKALLSIKEPNAQQRLAKKTISEGLSVRDLEALVSRVVVLDQGKKTRDKDGKLQNRAADFESFPEVTDRLRKTLGTKVKIRHGTDQKGRIEIEYFSEQELDRLVDLICE